jgi:hypothetical protein
MALDYIKDANTRKVMELLLIRQEWGRPIGGPSGIPADRLAALRTAFDATLKDPKFLDEAKKTKLEIEPLTGQQMEELLAKTYAFPPDVIQAASQLVQGKTRFDNCAKFAKDSKQCAKKKKKKKKQ